MRAFGNALKWQDMQLCICVGTTPDAELLSHSSWAAFRDISHDSLLAESCGFTWADIEALYSQQLTAAQAKLSLSALELKNELTAWYGNYTFTHIPCEPLYCPHSITQFFRTFSFGVHRRQSQFTRTVAQIATRFPDMLSSAQVYVPVQDKSMFDLDHCFNYLNRTEAAGLLRSEGLLSIQKYLFPGEYRLVVPNRTEKSMLAALAVEKAIPGVVVKCFQHLNSADFEGAVQTINEGLATVSGARDPETVWKHLQLALAALSAAPGNELISTEGDRISIRIVGKHAIHVTVVTEKDDKLTVSGFQPKGNCLESDEFVCKLLFSVEKLQIIGGVFRQIRSNSKETKPKETELSLNALLKSSNKAVKKTGRGN